MLFVLADSASICVSVYLTFFAYCVSVALLALRFFKFQNTLLLESLELISIGHVDQPLSIYILVNVHEPLCVSGQEIIVFLSLSLVLCCDTFKLLLGLLEVELYYFNTFFGSINLVIMKFNHVLFCLT